MASNLRIPRSGAWPALALADWKDTRDTLHMWMQIAGKVRLEFSPHINHWWEVPLYVSARGLTTSPIPYPDGIFEINFDFIDHKLDIVTSSNRSKTLRLYTRTVAGFYREFIQSLRDLGIEAKIWPMPVEVSDPIRFDEDVTHSRYDPEYAHRFWRLLVTLDTVFKEFRARFIGKVSPVHFFWGSCDLAVTRFSGKAAPDRPGADKITKDAYSHEEISAGWWPGGGGVENAAFYAYAAPEPVGFREHSVLPAAAYYDAKLGEFILPYEDVRNAADPQAALLQFLETTYAAGADLGKWDRRAIEKPL